MVTARRSPGSSSPQPVLRAKCTVSEAAARTAASSASCDAGARGSSTTSGRESASEISLRSIIPRAARDAGPVDARRGRALAVRAQAVDLRLGRRDQRRAGVGGHALAAAGVARTGQTRGSTSSSSACGAGHDALGEAERVAQHERGRGEPAPSAAPEGHLHAHACARAARAQADGLGQQRLVDPAGRQRQPPAPDLDPDGQRLLLDDAALADLALDGRRPRRRGRSRRRRPRRAAAARRP